MVSCRSFFFYSPSVIATTFNYLKAILKMEVKRTAANHNIYFNYLNVYIEQKKNTVDFTLPPVFLHNKCNTVVGLLLAAWSKI